MVDQVLKKAQTAQHVLWKRRFLAGNLIKIRNLIPYFFCFRELDLSQNMLEKIDNKTHGVLDDCLSIEKVIFKLIIVLRICLDSMVYIEHGSMCDIYGAFLELQKCSALPNTQYSIIYSCWLLTY